MTQTLLLLNVAVGTVLPALVGFVTHRHAPAQVKSLLLLALSAVSAVLTASIQQGSFHYKAVLVSFATTFFAGVGAHFGLLKPAGVTGESGAVSGVGLSIGQPAPATAVVDTPVPPATPVADAAAAEAPASGEGDAAP